MVNLDTNEVSLDMDTLKDLPAEEELKLHQTVQRLVNEVTQVRGRFSRKRGPTAAEFNESIEDAFNGFMLSIFGEYRRFLDPNKDWEMDIDAYTKLDAANKHGQFLTEFRESQMFEAWCTERTELAQRKFPSSNKFESQVSTIVRKKEPQAEGAAKLPRATSTGSGSAASDAGEEFAVGYGSKAGVVRVEDDRIKGVRTHLPYHPPLLRPARDSTPSDGLLLWLVVGRGGPRCGSIWTATRLSCTTWTTPTAPASERSARPSASSRASTPRPPTRSPLVTTRRTRSELTWRRAARVIIVDG